MALLEYFFGYGKHAPFGHSRRAERAGVLEDDDGFRCDRKVGVVDSCGEIVVVLKDDSRAGVLQEVFFGGDHFNDTAVRREVSAKDEGSAFRREGVVKGADNVGVERFGGFDVLAEGVAVDGWGVEVEEGGDVLEDCAESAGVVEVFHEVLARGPDVGNERGFARDGIEVVEGEVNAGTVGHGENVDDGVGRAAYGHIGGDGVFKGWLGKDGRGFDIVPDHIDDSATCACGHACVFGMDGGD